MVVGEVELVVMVGIEMVGGVVGLEVVVVHVVLEIVEVQVVHMVVEVVEGVGVVEEVEEVVCLALVVVVLSPLSVLVLGLRFRNLLLAFLNNVATLAFRSASFFALSS